ncbi:MerR family transcriptional regulator [Roseomonas sp. CAU 1739]|uniref:MerR family transcriptional regulator n=1 Tax=Roseomonas sp. CAU 1739 TaxID=3140364 RepID=UPI00325A59EF
MTRHASPAVASEQTVHDEPKDATASLDAVVAPNEPNHDINPKDIPAATFAALVGRNLRTLSRWDNAGLTHPEIRRSRRYYSVSDLAAVLVAGMGCKGPRPGSLIKYLPLNFDNGTCVKTGFT